MSIPLPNETLLTLSEASESLPGNPHVSTIHRWRRLGVRGVKLETCLIGGRRFTSHEALARFLEGLSVQDGAEPKRTSGRDQDRLVQKLGAEGL